MRIVVSPSENRVPDIRVLGNDGTDLTRELAIAMIEIRLTGGEFPVAVLHCEMRGGLDAYLPPESVRVEGKKP